MSSPGARIAEQPVRVVIADDAPEMRMLLRLRLQGHGIEVVGEAEDGIEAVDLALARTPDLVLLDIAMPRMDGLEAAAALRASGIEMKIVLLSAYSAARMRPEALRAGADEYVEKSAPIDALATLIRHLCPETGGRGEAADELTALPPDVAELSEGDVRFRTVLDALEEAVVVVDASGVVELANFAATGLFGLAMSQLTGHEWVHLPIVRLDADGLPFAPAELPIIRALRTARPESAVPIGIVRPDGSLAWAIVSVRPLRQVGAARAYAAIASFMDITEQRLAEQHRRVDEERFRASVDALMDAFAILSSVRDRDGAIVDFRFDEVNEAACRSNEMTREQLVGHNLLELLPAHVESGLFDAYCQLVETGEPLHHEALSYEDVFGSGRRISKAVELRAVRLGDGFVVTWRDDTERKQAEERLTRSNRELHDFAAVLAHDLRNPLLAVRGFVELALELTPDLDGRVRELLERSVASANRVEDMIAAMLEWASPDGGISLAPVALDDVIADVLEMLGEQVEEAGASVLVEPLPIVSGDARQLARLFANLVGNAIKYARPGVPPSIDISAAKRGTHWRVTVSDNGIGIPDDDREAVFGIFHRPSRHGTEGSGIGLAVCRRIAEAHGGTVEIVSQEGPGASFVVTLPADGVEG